jgi:itaconyl-CoA hydratase
VQLLGFDEITLPKPTFGGDTLYAESEILEHTAPANTPHAGRVKVRTLGLNQRGETVAILVWDALIARAGHDDFTRVNY